jgi:adenine/guanine phosphoribosyltransferase-like PRPP-binding protein
MRSVFATEPAGGAAMNLTGHIRTIPDFPKPGIQFDDISTLLMHAGAWQKTVERLAEAVTREVSLGFVTS